MIAVAHNAASVVDVMDKLAQEFPREYPAALATLGVWAAGVIKRDMRLQRGVKPLSGITKQYDSRLNNVLESRKGIGRKLQSAVRYVKSGTKVDVGFIGSADYSAGLMMGRESRPLSDKEIDFRKSLGITVAPYYRPERPFISNFANAPGTSTEVARVMVGRINAIFEKRAERAKRR